MSGVEAVGDMVGGSLLARAVEPGAGELTQDGHTHESRCLNCGADLTGPFCHECGQRGHVHRTVGAFFHDLAHGVFHIEGKTWHTLPLLAWRPGDLTRRYVEGQRARFVSPMALFLFSVFLMFAVISTVAPIQFNDAKAKTDIAANAAENARQLDAMKRQRAALIAAHKPTAAIDQKINDKAEDARFMGTMAEKGVIGGSAVGLADKMPSWLGEPVRKAVANPEFTLYKLKSSAYKWSWALIPLSVPFLWLLFPFSRRYRTYDHTVFVTYSLSFMTLLVVVLTLASTAGIPGVALAAIIVPPIHMYRQLRGAYSLGRASALLRTVLLVVCASIALVFFATLMILVGLLD